VFKRNIPNAITCGNLLCGCFAIVKCFEGDLVLAAYLVCLAAILDFFDGFAARLLKVSSPIGKDLDSLADMVTFGVVPGVMMYNMIYSVLPNSSEMLSLIDVLDQPNDIGGKPNFQWYAKQYNYLPYIAFLIPAFSAIRLAKFNNDTRQAQSFIGLPTPANAIFICSLPLFVKFDGINDMVAGSYLPAGENQSNFLSAVIENPFALCLMSGVLSLLLVAPIPLFALKFKNFKWKGNEIRYSFLLCTVLLISFFQFVGIPLVIISYILFSLINNFLMRKPA